MKKSQILAALALAFALGLGVVAPVANTYAKMATEGITTEQTAEINNLTSYANILASSTKNLANYEKVYDKVEDATTKLQDKAAAQLKTYKEDIAPADSSLNAAIEAANLRAGLAFDDDNLKVNATAIQASRVNIAKLGDKATLKEAYDALQKLVADVAKNKEVADNNYTGDAVTALDTAYTSVTNLAQAAIDAIEDAFAAGPAIYGTAFSDAFKAIDKEAWEDMEATDEWKDADDNSKTEAAVKWGMIIKVAKALPKYNLVPAVETAKEDFDKLAASNDTVVDYEHAISFTNAYINAVMAFRGETTTTNPSATLRTLTSGDVTVVAYLDADVTLEVAPATTSAFGDKAHKAYDIVLKKASDANWTFSGNAVVTIKTGALDASKTSAYYLNGNNAEGLSTIRGEGVVSFTATHFSVYAIVQDGQSQVVDGIGGTNGEDDPSAPGTGLVSTAEGNAATTVSIVAGLATALTALGAGVVAYRSARRSEK